LPKVPGTFNNPQPTQIPFAPLSGANIQVSEGPEGQKMLIIGPVLLGLPLLPQHADQLAKALKGSEIQIVKPGEVQGL
jgi:hypothetical protein